MSYRAWRGCKCVHIRLVSRVGLCLKARGDKTCKKEYKAELKCKKKGAERWTWVSSAMTPFNWNNSCVKCHFNCTRAIMVRPVVCTDLASAAQSCEWRGIASGSVTADFVQQMEADSWLARIRALLLSAWHNRPPVFWLGIGLGSQCPSHGGVISISTSCIRRRSLTHHI